MEESVTFKNNDSKTLFGIIHILDKSSMRNKRIGVNLLNPEGRNRVAPHRLNVRIGNKLWKEGFSVFRFNPQGFGDSERELPPGKSIIEIWGMIQRGLFVNDTKLSNDYFMKNYNMAGRYY